MPLVRLLLIALCATAAYATNPIQVENAKPGTGEWRLFSESVNGEIEGYGSATSVNQGQSISFYVNTTAATYELDIFRLGWYGGEGGRRVANTVIRTGVQQVIPTPDPVTGLIECNWVDPYTITIPNDWVSGAYLVKLTTIGTVSEKNKYILFVVREDTRQANHNFQLTVSTAQAYNDWGGKSLYGTSPARKVSFNRPYTDGSGTGNFLWRWEYNAVRFLEREGYDLTYTTNIDTHRRGHLLLNAKSFLSIGHDEYWSWEMRTNVENALANGVNLGIFSANTCYWQVRFEPSQITGALDRTIVGYKAAAMTMDPFALDGDPSNDQRITTLWRDPPVNRPESALLGVQYIYYPVNEAIVIDDVTSEPWVFEETGLTTGSTLPGLLGYEVDAMNELTPQGTVRLGHSPFPTENGPTMYSDMTIYDAGPAWVFATGSIQWAWGLDSWNGHKHPSAPVTHGAQQITRNLLRKFAGARAYADCQTVINPTSAVAGVSAGSGTIELSTASNCAWTISSSAAWLTFSGAASGTGSATIPYQYASNAGAPARAATLMIGDATFSLFQENGCAYSYAPSSGSIGAPGGNLSFTITTTGPCPWTASTQESWMTVTSAGSGFGSTTVNVTVAANEGPSRDGGVYLNGTYFNVHQSGGCTYSAQPTSVALPASGGEGEVAVTTNSGCFWSSSLSTSPWIVITSGSTGQGNGVTAYTVQANTTGAARTGTIVVAGINVTVRQSADNCLYDFAPLWRSHTSGAGTGTITVTSSCEWSAIVESGANFITITSTSPTTLTYSVAQNTSAFARSGTIRIAGRAISITQNGAGMPVFSLTATATSTSTASLTWAPVAGAAEYEIYRSSNGSGLTFVERTSSTSRPQTGLAANRTYLFRVRAIDATGVLAYSNIDPATTIIFTDPTIVPGVTRVKAVHITQLRAAVNLMRAAGLLTSQVFNDASLSGVRIKAVHIAQLHGALNVARATIGLPPITFSQPSLSVVRASHINDLRAGVQ